MSEQTAGLTLTQRVVMWILNTTLLCGVALYPVYLMAGFQPDDVVHYGFLCWMAVAGILYWSVEQLFFTEPPAEARVGRMLLAITAAVVLLFGVFSPIVSFPFVGGVDYFRDNGDGYIVLIMTGLALALAVTGRWKQVLAPALGSLAAIIWTFLSVQQTISQARAGVAAELAGNPHGGLASSVMQSIEWEWAWVLLFAGSGLLVYSAARRDRMEEFASPPLVSVPVEDVADAAGEAAAATADESAAAVASEGAAGAAPAPEAAASEPAAGVEPEDTPADTAEAAAETASAEPADAADQPAEAVAAEEAARPAEFATAPETAAAADATDQPAEASADETAAAGEESGTAEAAAADQDSAGKTAEPAAAEAPPQAEASTPEKPATDAEK